MSISSREGNNTYHFAPNVLNNWSPPACWKRTVTLLRLTRTYKLMVNLRCLKQFVLERHAGMTTAPETESAQCLLLPKVKKTS